MSESLEKFTSIAKEDHQRAKTLFFSEAFKEEFLKDKQNNYIISCCWEETEIRS